MLKLILGICIGALIVIIAGQLHDRKTRTIPLSAIETTGYHEYQKPPAFTGTTISGIGGVGHPPFAVDETRDAAEFKKQLGSIGPIGRPPVTGIEPLLPDKAEIKKALHDSLKTKAADGNEAGDW